MYELKTTQIDEMVVTLRKELNFVKACDDSDARSVANLNEVIKNEEAEEMSSERRAYLYNMLVCFLNKRADNSLKIEQLRNSIKSLESLVSAYELIG